MTCRPRLGHDEVTCPGIAELWLARGTYRPPSRALAVFQIFVLENPSAETVWSCPGSAHWSLEPSPHDTLGARGVIPEPFKTPPRWECRPESKTTKQRALLQLNSVALR